MKTKTITILVALPLLLSAPALAETAKGIVFDDANKNRILDPGEKGIPDVLVSNGETVVKTNAVGQYQLEVDNDTILFVIQPSGWQVPSNEQNLPQYYYIHKPEGSPKNLKYKGVDPTGPLPASINFPLNKIKDNDKFSFFAFGDPQPYSTEDVDYFHRDIVEQAKHEKTPVAGVYLGDIVGDDLDLFENMNASTAQMGRPWWHVYGNHDMNFDVTDPEHADETFERFYGPATFAFEIGNVLFIGLDNVIYPNHITDYEYIGGFTDKQLTFIENLLSKTPSDRLVVTMTHIPFYNTGTPDTIVDEHRDRFFALFKNHKYTFSISAHTHTQNHVFFDQKEYKHWPHKDTPHHHYNVGASCGSWWTGVKDKRGIPEATMSDGTPNGYAILHFDDNQYSYTYRVANGPKEKVMNVYAPVTAPQQGPWGYAMLSVNFYNGTEDTKVEYRVNKGEWKKLSKVDMTDPEYTYKRLSRDKLQTGQPTSEPLPYPTISSHIWTTHLPTTLEIGEYEVDVRVTDRFGRVFKESTSYKITKGDRY